jgi:hypothetical protein
MASDTADCGFLFKLHMVDVVETLQGNIDTF